MYACIRCPGAGQHVFQSSNLTSNDHTPCFGETVDFICYYPAAPPGLTSIWLKNGTRVFPDDDVIDQRSLNLTASRLRVRIDQAVFTGDLVSFTCYLPLASGGKEISNSIIVDPQGRLVDTGCTTQLCNS